MELECHRKTEEWLEILSTAFRFRIALPYPTRTEAVLMASHKQLPKIKRPRTLEILKRMPSPRLRIDRARTYRESHLPSWLFKDVTDHYAMFL